MPHVDDRAAGGAPFGEQRETVGVGPIVPAPRPAGLVEALLHIDGEKDGAVEVECHGVQLIQMPAIRPINSLGRPISWALVRWPHPRLRAANLPSGAFECASR